MNSHHWFTLQMCTTAGAEARSQELAITAAAQGVHEQEAGARAQTLVRCTLSHPGAAVPCPFPIQTWSPTRCPRGPSVGGDEERICAAPAPVWAQASARSTWYLALRGRHWWPRVRVCRSMLPQRKTFPYTSLEDCAGAWQVLGSSLAASYSEGRTGYQRGREARWGAAKRRWQEPELQIESGVGGVDVSAR